MKRKNKFKSFLMRLRKMLPGISAVTSACSAPTGPAPILCLYPLDDQGTVGPLFGESVLVMNSPDFTSFNYTAVAVPPGGISMVAARAAVNDYATLIPLEANKNKIFQFRLSQWIEYYSFISIDVYKVNAGGALTGDARIGFSTDGVQVSPTWQINGGAYQVDPEPYTGNPLDAYITGYITGAGQLVWAIGETDMGVLPGFTVAVGERVGLGLIIDQNSIDLPNGQLAGEFYSNGIIQPGTFLTFTPPFQATDICGNPLTF